MSEIKTSSNIYIQYLKSFLSFLFLDWYDDDKYYDKSGKLMCVWKYWKIVLYIFLIISTFFNMYFDSYLIKIQDKYLILETYRVGAANLYDGELMMFEIEDSYIFGIFDSADYFNKIEKDKYYYVSTAGFRIPILSIFPKIIKMEEIKGELKE